MRCDIQQQHKNPKRSQQSDIILVSESETRVVLRLQALLSTSTSEDNECIEEKEETVSESLK